MEIREVSVGFSRRVSDGNFGSEEHNAHFVVTLKPGQDARSAMWELADRAEEEVYGRLAQSRSPAVRRAVTALTQSERRYDAYQSARMDAERDALKYVKKPDVDQEDDPVQGVG